MKVFKIALALCWTVGCFPGDPFEYVAPAQLGMTNEPASSSSQGGSSALSSSTSASASATATSTETVSASLSSSESSGGEGPASSMEASSAVTSAGGNGGMRENPQASSTGMGGAGGTGGDWGGGSDGNGGSGGKNLGTCALDSATRCSAAFGQGIQYRCTDWATAAPTSKCVRDDIYPNATWCCP